MQVSKWGNSLAVRLPRALVEALGLKVGDELTIVSSIDKVLEVEKRDQKVAALERMSQRQWTVPKGYRFDRDEANTR